MIDESGRMAFESQTEIFSMELSSSVFDPGNLVPFSRQLLKIKIFCSLSYEKISTEIRSELTFK